MITAQSLSLVGDKYLGTPYSTMDCQAFVERCLKDIGISINLPGSNAWFRQMTWTGSPEECKQTFGRIPVGAFLFILSYDGGEPEKYRKDGKGNANHMGIYIAREDGAIHSSSSQREVCYSKFAGRKINGGWNQVGLWDRLSYGDQIDSMLRGNGGSGGNGGKMKAKIVAANGLPVRLRKTPSSDGDVITKLQIGTEVEVLSSSPSWCEVEWNGQHGYMMTAFLEITDEDPGEGKLYEVQLTFDQFKALIDLGETLSQKYGKG